MRYLVMPNLVEVETREYPEPGKMLILPERGAHRHHDVSRQKMVVLRLRRPKEDSLSTLLQI